MTDATPPPGSKLTRSKQRWAREDVSLTDKVSRPGEQRLPPNLDGGVRQTAPIYYFRLRPGDDACRSQLIGQTAPPGRRPLRPVGISLEAATSLHAETLLEAETSPETETLT
jgi:hypothetical protein